MPEIEEHDPDVAAQVDALPGLAWSDYEAAIEFIKARPVESEIYSYQSPGPERYRTFGLGLGLIVYVIDAATNRITLDLVSFLPSD